MKRYTSVTYPDSRAVDYAFDEVGNRMRVTDNGTMTGYTTNALDQYTQAGSETFTYDTNGNLNSRTLGSNTTIYGWDEDDRLVSVDLGGNHIDYRYDYQGRLISKIIVGQETRYIWDGVNLIAEMDSSGQVIKRYIYGTTINEIILVSANGTNYWAQQDGLGSVVGNTNDNGEIVSTISYDVYGNVRNGNFGPVSQGFAGMWWDEDTGLYYVRARWYEPTFGRFLTYDQIFLKDGQNKYAYVVNNPVNYIDLLGLNRLLSNFVKFWDVATQEIGHLVFTNEMTSPETWHELGMTGMEALGLGGFAKFWDVATQEIGHLAFTNEMTSPETWHELGMTGMEALGLGDFAKFWDVATQEIGHLAFTNEMTSPETWHELGMTGMEALGFSDFAKFWDSSTSLLGDMIFGGTCPTFIQGGQACEEIIKNLNDSLMSRIKTPWPDSLLRSDIPIYGVALGKDFSRYRVEYGAGTNPNEWHLIEESDKPQEKAPVFNDISWMQGDLDLKGNLATWNVGLKNWSHLPWHPPEDQTDLNGVYTIRLVVEGKDGKTVEDRVTCDVGRVIAQCLPGIAISPDNRVVLRFPEQSLTHPFRIYTILPLDSVGEQIPTLPEGCKAVGSVYRIREPGDRFIKDVSLEFTTNKEELGKYTWENVGIGQYDTVRNEWVWLDTAYDKESATFNVKLSQLPEQKAIYALIHNPGKKFSAAASLPSVIQEPVKPVRPGVFVENSFESDLGTFKNRGRFVGAVLSRDNTATPDGSYCLKLTNQNFGGNFSCTILDKPFDVREYPIMGFDYKIGHDVKIDFLVKVNGRWYNLRFTDDSIDYRNRDVNIANLGWIEGAIADNKWHSASVDLHHLLRKVTKHTRVDEIIMADWDVGGYMKLEFGKNPRNATFYMDNFRILGSGSIDDKGHVLIVDDFNEEKSKNKLGGAFGAYSTPGAKFFETSIVDAPTFLVLPASTSGLRNRSLHMIFDTTKQDAYGGYWTSLVKADLANYSTLSFKMLPEKDIPQIMVGIRDSRGTEGKTIIKPYALAPDDLGWREVRIPLTALRGLSDFSSPDVLFFSATNTDGSGKGAIQIDDLRFEERPFTRVADFEPSCDWNLLGGDYTTFQNGAAAISTGVMKDVPAQKNNVLRISYGGTIGHDYGLNGGFSYVLWRAGLNGIDARQFTHLVMHIRGENGGETPNIYLSDSVRRIPMRAKEIPVISQEWQTIRLPLEHYAKQGIDVSHLLSMEMVFEWEKQSGTLYVDDIRFE